MIEQTSRMKGPYILKDIDACEEGASRSTCRRGVWINVIQGKRGFGGELRYCKRAAQANERCWQHACPSRAGNSGLAATGTDDIEELKF